MKIGILTFHNAHNYGAVLQAYALRTKLRNMGQEAHIINYCNPQIEAAYEEDLKMPAERYSLRHPRAWKRIWDNRRQTKFAQPAWRRQCNCFRKFIDTVLLEKQTKKYRKEELENLDMDLFLCGSDQIWTSWLTGGLDEVYFLDFKTRAKKAAYGASKFSADFSEEETEYFRKALRSFYAISVREQGLADALSSILQRTVHTVLDPTLLLEEKDYQGLETDIELPEKYILAYFVTEDEALMKCAQYAEKKLGIPLIEIHYYERRSLKGHHQVGDCSPGEFLTYIKKADMIFTNSFHGLVFSVIYHKKFYCVYEQDSRKDCLLEKLKLEDRHIYGETGICIEEEIVYEDVSRRLETLKKASETFLLGLMKED